MAIISSNPLLRITAIMIAGLLITLSAILNYKYWYSQAPQGELAYLMGSASFLTDLVKPLTPFFLVAAIRENNLISILAATLLLITCVCFSFASAIGLSSVARYDGGTLRHAKLETYNNLRDERARIVAAINNSRSSHAPEEIDALMKALLAQPIKRNGRSFGAVGSRSKNCRKPDRYSRDQCARHADLFAKKTMAMAKRRNIARLPTIDAKLLELQGKGLVSTADPQASLFSALIGIEDINTVRNALVVLFAWTLEYVGLILPFFLFRSKRDANESAAQTITTLHQPATMKTQLAPLKPVTNKTVQFN